MELCTTTSQPLPNLLIPNPNSNLRPKPSLQFTESRHSLTLRSRLVSIKATSSDESGENVYSREEPDGIVSTYDVPPPEKESYVQAVVEEARQEDPTVNGSDGQSQISELFKNFNVKLDDDDAYVYLIYGSGALVILWLASAIIGAIDSIPLFPKLMEVVGLGYTIWFSSRYLIFKKNREELVAEVKVLKQQVLGSNDD